MNRKYTIEVFNKHAVIMSNFSIDDEDYVKFKQVEDMLNNPNDYRISKRMRLKVNNDDAGFDAYFHEKPYEGHITARVAKYDNYPFCTIPKIEKVIFNDPATIVFWADDTKTVVKRAEYEKYDAEKGLAMAICKKVYGNKGNYYNEFKKWLPDEWTPDVQKTKAQLDEIAKAAGDLGKKLKLNADEMAKNAFDLLKACTYGGDQNDE